MEPISPELLQRLVRSRTSGTPGDVTAEQVDPGTTYLSNMQNQPAPPPPTTTPSSSSTTTTMPDNQGGEPDRRAWEKHPGWEKHPAHRLRTNRALQQYIAAAMGAQQQPSMMDDTMGMMARGGMSGVQGRGFGVGQP
jgi:hypothetical protein